MLRFGVQLNSISLMLFGALRRLFHIVRLSEQRVRPRDPTRALKEDSLDSVLPFALTTNRVERIGRRRPRCRDPYSWRWDKREELTKCGCEEKRSLTTVYRLSLFLSRWCRCDYTRGRVSNWYLTLPWNDYFGKTIYFYLVAA